MTDSQFDSRHVFRVGNRLLDCRPSAEPVVMGILNVTPDSFSDGGLYLDPDAALRRAESMLNDGATIVDVGGASSRPRGRVYGEGALPVDTSEEIRRVVPVVSAISAHHPNAVISIDTTQATVARAALEAGAHIVNDITAFRSDDAMPSVVAEFDVPAILMHSIGDPGALSHVVHYGDVAEEVCTSLTEAVHIGKQAGVDKFVLDPGFGFGKSAADNLRLIRDLGSIRALGYPVAVGLSRKSTIGSVLGSPGHPLPIEERLSGTLGATAVAVLNGASIVRTHDVVETARMLRVIQAIRSIDRAPLGEEMEVNA